MRKSVAKQVKIVATRYVGIAIFISRATPKHCLMENSEMDYFSDHLSWNCTGPPSERLGSGIDIGVGEDAVPMDSLLLIQYGIYKLSVISQSTMFTDLGELQLDSVGLAASF